MPFSLRARDEDGEIGLEVSSIFNRVEVAGAAIAISINTGMAVHSNSMRGAFVKLGGGLAPRDFRWCTMDQNMMPRRADR